MTATRTANCPTCNVILGDDDLECTECGAEGSLWRQPNRTPLILPGNPALSDEVVPTTISPTRIAGASLAGCAALIAVFYIFSVDAPFSASALINAFTGDEQSIASEDSASPTAEGRPASSELAAPKAVAAAVAIAPPRAPAVAVIAPRAPVVTIAPPRAPAVAVIAPRAPVVTIATPRAPAVAIVPPRAPVVPAAPQSKPAAAPITPVIAAAIPVLQMTPLVSNGMRAGESLRLRGSVLDVSSGRVLPIQVRYTTSDVSIATVDSRSGMVLARAPGRVRIVADAGQAGASTVLLIVRSSGASDIAIAAPVVAQATQGSSAAMNRATTSSVAPVVPEPASISSELVRGDRVDNAPDATEIRSAAEKVVSSVRNGGIGAVEMRAFFADGANHRVTLVNNPARMTDALNDVRVAFVIRATKFDGGGRPVTRLVPVTMDVAKRGGVVSTADVTIGTMQRP